ncbi:MAG: dTDP-glucose 4,6-dehydratase, partial [Firmicutes bacterium]|nr:dTDP-glucose 4,6-dehydratase [Bacillota bacterium]
MRLLVTGGLGFIGSRLINWILQNQEDVHIVNVDALTYAGNLANLAQWEQDARYTWVKASIADPIAMQRVFQTQSFDAVVNLAAESHVDRSIHNGLPFVDTNVRGTEVLLEAARQTGVPRFLQVSTDEVYGSRTDGQFFTEDSPLHPSSPYAASKAAADEFVMAAATTYGQNVVITRCTNNYGPQQFPEKLIPLCITNGLEGKPWPLYGDGQQVRDWIYVDDHARGIWEVLQKGNAGTVYNLA